MPQTRLVLLIVTLLATMAIACTIGVRQRWGAVVLALTGFVWLLVNTQFEGATLWVVSSTHGLTTSDLVGLAGMVIAACQLWRLRR